MNKPDPEKSSFSYFYEVFNSHIRASPKNAPVRSFLRTCTSKSLDSLHIIKARSSLRPEENEVLDESGLFAWFLINRRKMRDLIPDIEFLKYREICLEMISTLGSCCEAHFGLGKLYAHEASFDTALQHIRIALSENKSDLTYNRWHSVLNIFRVNSKKRGLQAKKIAYGNKKTAFLKHPDAGVEVLWALMELAATDHLKIGLEIESPMHYTSKIYEIDRYYGSIAWSSIFIIQGNKEKGEALLREIIEMHPKRPEAYLKLWGFLYEEKKFSDSAEVSEKGFSTVSRKSEYYIIFILNYARSLFKLGKIRKCLELLQLEYTKYSLFTVILYHYGRFCVKSKDLQFLGSAIGALEECLNTTSESRHGQVYYWLAKAYLLAEEKISAFACAKKAVPLLTASLEKQETSDKPYEKNLTSKLNELKDIMKELHIHLISIDLLERLLDEPPLKLEECKIYCDALKSFDVLEGSLYEAKMWWKAENLKKAKEILYSRLSHTRVKMKAYFLLAEILENEGNYDEKLAVSKEIVKKCSSPMIPVQIWIEANMIYADSLIKQQKYTEALFVYKTLAQVQPIPYIPDVRYLREMQKASTKEELDGVVPKILKGERRNSYSANQNEFLLKRMKLVCNKNAFSTVLSIEEEDESLSEQTFTFSTDRSETDLIGNRAPKPLAKNRMSCIPCGDSANIGFSVTTSYIFLYKIGKTCAKYRVNNEEGLLALHDFLNTHHYWTREGIEVHEELKVKAKFWLGILYYQNGQIELAEEVFRDILSMLFQLGRTKMSNEVLQILNSKME